MKKLIPVMLGLCLPGLALAQTPGAYYPPAGAPGYGAPGAYGSAPGGYAPGGGYGPGGYWGRSQPGRLLPAPPPPPSDSPQALLRQGIERLLRYLSSNQGGGDAALRQFVDIQLAPFFDFAYMSKWAAGPNYARLDEAQRQRLQTRLQDMFFSAMVRNISGLGTGLPQVQYQQPRRGRYEGEMEVPVRVWQQGSPMPTDITFRLYRSDQGWRVFDVSANGNSALVYYRQYFRRMMRDPRFQL